MEYDIFEDRLRKCPVCGKEFIMPPENVYKLVVKGKVVHYCSYTCFRVIQKRLESRKKYRRRT